MHSCPYTVSISDAPDISVSYPYGMIRIVLESNGQRRRCLRLTRGMGFGHRPTRVLSGVKRAISQRLGLTAPPLVLASSAGDSSGWDYEIERAKRQLEKSARRIEAGTKSSKPKTWRRKSRKRR